MVTVIKRELANFRIDIKEIKTGKCKTISLYNNTGKRLEDIKEMIISCIDRKH